MNPAQSFFCNACGSTLKTISALNENVLRFLDTRIESGIAQRFKDQKVVEIETSQLIMERTLNWAKLFGFFLGIPLLVVTGILSFFGFQTYSDIRQLLDKPKLYKTISILLKVT